jgi:hypothetical protein
MLSSKLIYSDFGKSLERRLISELVRSSDNNIRFLISDGFYPKDWESESGFLWITGNAMITEDNWRSGVWYFFRARVGLEDVEPDDLDLSTMLPRQDDSDWLSVDRPNRSLEMILA